MVTGPNNGFKQNEPAHHLLSDLVGDRANGCLISISLLDRADQRTPV